MLTNKNNNPASKPKPKQTISKKKDINRDLSDVKAALPKRMKAKSKEVADHVVTLRVISLALFLALMMSIYSNSRAPDNIWVRYTPNLNNGGVVRAGEIPNASLLTDTAYLWIAFSTWKENGEKNTSDNLWRYQHFFSPEFMRSQEQEYDRLRAAGHLNRTREVSLAPGMLSNINDRVIQKSRDSWVVYLDATIVERYLGEEVKNTTIRYPLRIERHETNPEFNPLGIRIVGYDSPPRRIVEN